ncbi:MAG: peptide deformylase [Atopobiaceae bacterium]|nr:peptide deformylase [Atopobiaceae bacterium]
MERPIVRSRLLLGRVAEPATADDLPIAHDLLDTLAAHAQTCAGMAANMIGQNKRIIVFADGNRRTAMLNPQIIRREGPYQTQEGCLSLDGLRPTTRYRKITVTWQDLDLREHTKAFQGFVAQVIQHEVDHCEGIVI